MPIYRRSAIAFVLLAAIVALGSLYGFNEKDREKTLDAAERNEAEAPLLLTVYVCGAVNRPGVVQLADGSRVVDAVQACGGFLPNAEPSKTNMAAALKDGMQITVSEKIPAEGAVVSAGKSSGTGGARSADGVVHINTADATELDRLPGVGPSLARAIVEYREEHGAFGSLEDLKKVRGIGAAKFQKMQDKAAL